jgi:uncharacterized protein YegP (UPF0339 family)
MARYEHYRSQAGDYRWRLVAGNGKTVASGEGYATRHGVLRGIQAHRRAACTERIFEVSAGKGGGIGGPGEE